MEEIDKMETLIGFVVDLAAEDDVLWNNGVSGEYYFTHGGCYDLYQIINHYVPESNCMINESLDHCAIEYNGNIYDATGKIKANIKSFYRASKEDEEYMKRNFGLDINTLKPENMINNIKECRVEGHLYPLS